MKRPLRLLSDSGPWWLVVTLSGASSERLLLMSSSNLFESQLECRGLEPDGWRMMIVADTSVGVVTSPIGDRRLQEKGRG